jgi:hypothetical protein
MSEITSSISTEGSGSIHEGVSGNVARSDINILKENVKQLRSELLETKRSFSSDKISLITVLGIFVSIFTFISVEIQVLKYICDFYKIVGFTFILPAILMIFVVTLDYVARSWIDNNSQIAYKKICLVLVVIFILMFVGIYFIQESKQDWMCGSESPGLHILPIEKTVSNEINLPEYINIKLSQ